MTSYLHTQWLQCQPPYSLKPCSFVSSLPSPSGHQTPRSSAHLWYEQQYEEKHSRRALESYWSTVYDKHHVWNEPEDKRSVSDLLFYHCQTCSPFTDLLSRTIESWEKYFGLDVDPTVGWVCSWHWSFSSGSLGFQNVAMDIRRCHFTNNAFVSVTCTVAYILSSSVNRSFFVVFGFVFVTALKMQIVNEVHY